MSAPAIWVLMYAASSSTAKCTKQRFQNGSFLSRRRYWAMACCTFWLVKWFFSSTDTMGKPLSRMATSCRLVGRFGGKMHLPYHGKAVAFITCLMFLVATGRRAEKGQLQVDAAERHAIPQNFQRATFLNQTRHMRCSSDLCALGVWKGGSNNLRRHNFHDKTSTVLDSS